MLSNSYYLDNDLQPAAQDAKFKESISCIRWAQPCEGHERLFAVGTWDGQLRIYNIEDNPNNNQLALVQKFFKQVKWPVIDIAWSKNNKSLYYTMIDNTVCEIDLHKPTINNKVCSHSDIIRNIFYFEGGDSLVTASFDKTIKTWDLKKPTPSSIIELGHKPYATDMCDSLIGCGLSNETVVTIQLSLYNKKSVQMSQLGKHSQIQCLAIDPIGSAMAYGSNDGRVSLIKLTNNYIMGVAEQTPIFSFKAEKQEIPGSTIMHNINAIGFNSRNPKWFFTASSQALSAWNYQSKNRVDSTPTQRPVTSCGVSHSGQFMAYGLGNDYHLGPDVPLNQPTDLRVHYITDIEVEKTKWV